MQVREFELSVGDVLQIDDRIVTVIDIDGSDVSLRVSDCFEEGVGFEEIADSAIRPGKS